MSFGLNFNFSMMPDNLNVKTNEVALMQNLSPQLPLLHLDCEAGKADWDEQSPSLTDSLLSLDFESVNDMGTTMMSSVMSESSQTLATPPDLEAMSLFSPTGEGQSILSDSDKMAGRGEPIEPIRKRQRCEPVMSPTSLMATDFTLFPGENEHSSPKASVDGGNGEKVLHLLDKLNASQQNEVPLTLSPTDVTPAPGTCLPQAIQSSRSSPAVHTASSVPSKSSAETSTTVKQMRGTGRRRRRDADELLPIDAPIQPRVYHTESATSRRDSRGSESSSPGESGASTPLSGSQEMDARSLKRLSNTLAARRSRHRKAEELKRLYETIERLEKEVTLWKQRCESVEQERNRALLLAPRP
ncbi:DNA-binding transcription factor [Malassezia pachydermatis]